MKLPKSENKFELTMITHISNINQHILKIQSRIKNISKNYQKNYKK